MLCNYGPFWIVLSPPLKQKLEQGEVDQVIFPLMYFLAPFMELSLITLMISFPSIDQKIVHTS